MRLQQVKRNWSAIADRLRTRLPAPHQIRRRLLAAGCPSTFAEIGVDRELARKALLFGKDVRERYTVLHLAADLGKLEEWTSSILSEDG